VSIARARLQSYSLPLRDPWPSADGDVTERRGWIVALEDDLGRVGLGDAAPFPGFGLETHASAGAGLRLALTRLVGVRRDGYAGAIVDLPGLAPVAATPTARAAIDCALHDLIAQEEGVPLARYLGGFSTRLAVPVNGTIPRVPPERAAEIGARAVAAGIGTLKVKVGGASLREDEIRIRALREAVGPSVRIRVDANQAWSPEEAIESLRALASFDLEYAEQPVAAADLEGMARVRRECGVRIAADESVRDTKSAEMVHYRAAADILIVKPMAVGGLREARYVQNAAEDGGMPLVVTSLLESVVGRTAALHFAASLGETPFAHGVGTGGALTEDLADGPVVTAGAVPVPDRPGLGITLPESFWSGAHTVVEEE
jgi:o-succinylbenzoate synthase